MHQISGLKSCPCQRQQFAYISLDDLLILIREYHLDIGTILHQHLPAVPARSKKARRPVRVHRHDGIKLMAPVTDGIAHSYEFRTGPVNTVAVDTMIERAVLCLKAAPHSMEKVPGDPRLLERRIINLIYYYIYFILFYSIYLTNNTQIHSHIQTQVALGENGRRRVFVGTFSI